MSSNERTIEAAIIVDLGNIAAIATESAQILHWDDNATAKQSPEITVHAFPAHRIYPNYDRYRIRIELTAVTHLAANEDGSGAQRDRIYAALWEYINGLTADWLTAQTGLQIDGIVPMEGIDENADQFGLRIPSAELYCTLPATFPVTTTTTTTTP